MPLTNAGRDFYAQASMDDASPVFFNNANAALGVGDDTTPFNPAQTDLQAVAGSGNALRKGMTVGYPQRTANAITYQSLFGTTEANYAWAEWGIFNTLTNGTGVMQSRKVEALGTKTSAQSWQLTVTSTLVLG